MIKFNETIENFAAPGGLIQTGIAMLHDNKH